MVAVLLALRFVLELCLVGAAAVIGAAASDQLLVQLLAVVALVGAVAILWGALLAPRRKVDLPLAARVIIELALFLAAGIGLAATGHRSAGLALVTTELLLLTTLVALGYPPGGRRNPQNASRPPSARAT
jgi:O-antigen/teichoic acid export membrane protein